MVLRFSVDALVRGFTQRFRLRRPPSIIFCGPTGREALGVVKRLTRGERAGEVTGGARGRLEGCGHGCCA